MTNPATLRLAALYRYPVKGLSPEPLDSAALSADSYFPGDRLYAIENGDSGFDPAAPVHRPKVRYLMLMRDEVLATLHTRYDDATRVLTLSGGGEAALSADLGTPEGRQAVEDRMRRLLPGSLRGELRLLEAPSGYRFTDSPIGFVSLVNLASVRALEDMTGAPVDPLRFRANLHLEGLEPFAELEMSGRVLEGPGGTRLRLTQRTKRCAATNVDPATGIRDLDIPRTLDARFGHRDCGIYAEVIAPGRLGVGDGLAVAA